LTGYGYIKTKRNISRSYITRSDQICSLFKPHEQVQQIKIVHTHHIEMYM